MRAAEPEAAPQAERELFAARYDESAALYTKLLHDDPGWGAGYYGLVRSLIGGYRAPEAYSAAEEALRRVPEQAEAQAAAGIAAYRHGDIAQAELYFKRAFKINPNCPAAMSGLARIYSNFSRFKAARTFTAAAYKQSPNDPNLITAWANTLHGQEHVAALERALAIYDPASREARSLRAHITSDKAVGDRKLGRLTSPYRSYELKLRQIMNGPNWRIGVGLNVQFNGQRTFRLLLDTGASGMSLSPKAAEQAGLDILGVESDKVRGIGDDKAPDLYRYLASEVRIGDVILADFPVSVFRSAKSPDHDGLIGADVFQRFLIEIDFLGSRLSLEPYPDWQASESHEVEDASSTLPAGFVRALRFGNHLTVPTAVNQKGAYLFLVDSGSLSNIIDSSVAQDATKVYTDGRTVLQGIQGRVKEVGRASRISLAFAGFRQDNPDLLTMSMENQNDAFGVGLAGILGMPVLWQMRLALDYRNGAMRFDHEKK